MNLPLGKVTLLEMMYRVPSDGSADNSCQAWMLRDGPDAGVIAIVDDDKWVLRSLERLMKASGFEVQTFISAEDFLQSGNDSKPICVILDIGLPGMSGLDLQRRLSAEGRQLPVIFVSAHDEPEMRTEALAWGAIAFLGKPFNDKALLDAVNSVAK
jgi:FixJ family two-component response regulator